MASAAAVRGKAQVCPAVCGAASQPLAGRELVLLRPAGEADAWLRPLRRFGARALNLPVLRLVPVPDDDSCWARLRSAPADGWLLPVSPFAVRLAVRALGPNAAARRWLVVGPSSARLLREAGARCVLAPARRHDSEGLLALPELQDARIAGRTVLLLAAPGGRELLAATLRERGAHVLSLSLYHRLPARLRPATLRAFDALAAPWLWASSAAALHALHQAVDVQRRARLEGLRLLVPGVRLAAVAAALGHRRIVEIGSASRERLIDFLLAAACERPDQGP